MRQRVHAGAVGGVHRVQRLDRQRHAGRARVVEQLGDAVAHLARAPAMSFEPAPVGVLRQAADDEHEARRAERQRLVDGAAIVVARRGAARGVGRGNIPPRQYPESSSPVARRRAAVASRPSLATWSRHGEILRMPWRAQPSMICAQRPLRADRRGVEREQGGVGGGHRACACLRGERRNVDPAPVLPRRQRALDELHALRALAQRPPERRVRDDVADEELPLRLEAVVVRRRVRARPASRRRSRSPGGDRDSTPACGVLTRDWVLQSASPATAEPCVPSTWKVTRSSRRTRVHQLLLIVAMTPPSSSNIA